MTNEALSNLSIQLELSDIHQRLRSLHLRIEAERTDPEDGPLFAHLRFAESSLRSAAGTLDPVLVRTREVHPPGPVVVPERKRWSLFRD